MADILTVMAGLTQKTTAVLGTPHVTGHTGTIFMDVGRPGAIPMDAISIRAIDIRAISIRAIGIPARATGFPPPY